MIHSEAVRAMCALVFIFIPHLALSAAEEKPTSAIDKDLAISMSHFGLTFVVGTYDILANSSKTPVPAQTAEEIGAQGTALIKNYKNQVRDGAFGANLLHATGEVAITASQALYSTAIVTAVPAAAVASIARSGNDYVRSYLVKDTMEKASATLTKGLDTMSKAEVAQFDAFLKDGKHKEAADYFEERTHRLSKMKGAIDDDNAVKVFDSAIQSALINGTAAAITQAGMAYSMVNNLEGEFTNHVKGVAAFTKATAHKFQQLDESISDLQADVGEVKSKLDELENIQGKTSLQVASIQEILFDKEPPAVKLALLESGAKPYLTTDQKADLKKILETQVAQQKLLDKANAVVNYARDLNTILTAAGVHDENLGKAVQYGSVATTALSQAFAGNYLGAVASVSGLFGGGGQDPVQAQLAQIFEKLAMIDRKLDQVIDLQVKTLEAVHDLSVQLAKVEKGLHERFDRIDFELSILATSVQNEMWEDINSCAAAWSLRNGVSNDAYDPSEMRFSDLSAMLDYTHYSRGEKVVQCHEKLSLLFSGIRHQDWAGNPISLELALSKFGADTALMRKEYGKRDLEQYETELYSPSFQLLQRSWNSRNEKNKRWGGLSNAFTLLSTPSVNADDLRAKVVFLAKDGDKPLEACVSKDSLVGHRQKVYLCTDETEFREKDHRKNSSKANDIAKSFLETPIIRDQVGVLVQYAAFIAGPAEVAISDAPYVIKMSDLPKKKLASRGRELLTGALMVSDISIAQQAMIYGDLNAWFIFEEVWDRTQKRFRVSHSQSSSKEVYDLAVGLLKNPNNPWLQKNVLMLILQDSERPCSDGSGGICQSRSLLYRIFFDKFYPTEGTAEKTEFVPPPQQSIEAARNWFIGLFDIHPDISFTYTSTSTSDSNSSKVLFSLDGYSLPMPTVEDWLEKRLLYPPLMNDRFRDHVILAARLADYTVFDGMTDNDRFKFVALTSKGFR